MLQSRIDRCCPDFLYANVPAFCAKVGTVPNQWAERRNIKSWCTIQHLFLYFISSPLFFGIFAIKLFLKYLVTEKQVWFFYDLLLFLEILNFFLNAQLNSLIFLSAVLKCGAHVSKYLKSWY